MEPAIRTRHQDESRPDRAEAAQFQALLEYLLDDLLRTS
jgi:hypothetical protein